MRALVELLRCTRWVHTDTRGPRGASSLGPGLPVRLFFLSSPFLVAACSLAPESPPAEPRLILPPVSEATSPLGMVTTSSRQATEAAVAILESGGNAVDAAVAAAFTLGSADPATSGLGGMTYVLIRRADGTTTAIDGSAVPPVAMDRVKLHAAELANLDPELAAAFEFAAVPTTLQTLAFAAERYGTRPLGELLAPAIEVAEKGYLIDHPRRGAIQKYLGAILKSDPLRLLILRNGEEVPSAGDRRCNPDLARVLRSIATLGPREFTQGSIAREIEADMIRHGGFVRRSDLVAVRITESPPLTTTYRGLDVIAFPWPGAGGILVEMLNILERFAPEELSEDGADRIQILAEASHIAQADHLQLTRDLLGPSSRSTRDHLSKSFAAQRAQLIRGGRPLTDEDIGAQPALLTPGGGTTHVSVIDQAGNAVALIQTLGKFYGCKFLAPRLGFPYNSLLQGLGSKQLDHLPRRFHIPIYLAPAILLRNGAPFLVIGASGSAKAAPNTAITISNLVDRGMRPGEAVAAPRILWDPRKPGQELLLEMVPPLTRQMVRKLNARGYASVRLMEYPTPPITLANLGGVNLVYFDASRGHYIGVADPRRGGLARGPQL